MAKLSEYQKKLIKILKNGGYFLEVSPYKLFFITDKKKRKKVYYASFRKLKEHELIIKKGNKFVYFDKGE